MDAAAETLPIDPHAPLPLPPREPTDWPRYVWQLFGFWAVMLVVAPSLVLITLLSFGHARHTWVPKGLRLWGRIMLRVVGVRLVVEPAVWAELQQHRRRVLVIDHASTMDLFVVGAVWPDNAVGIAKREMFWLPVMGQAMWLLGFLPLDRGRRAKAVASLQRAAERARRESLTVFIAPEGTRSEDGQLQPFKLGAFHLAAAADAPIVPLVLHGTRWLWPKGQKACRRGVVTVRLLPIQPSGADDASAEAIHARAEHLHDLYARELHAMARTVPLH